LSSQALTRGAHRRNITCMQDKAPRWYHPDIPHDYAPTWDYLEDEDPDPGVVGIVQQAEAALRTGGWLERLGIPGFSVFFVEMGQFRSEQRGPAIAVYVSGTASWPFVGIDAGEHLHAAEDEGHLRWGLATSLLHELAHAHEEALGIDVDEDRVEAWAQAAVGALLAQMGGLDRPAPAIDL